MPSSSNYYKAFGGGTGGTCFGFTTKYPKCVCEDACGPFVQSSSNLMPFRDKVREYKAANYIWIILFESSFGPWLLVFLAFMLASTRKNTIKVTVSSFQAKEKVLETHILSLEAEKKKNTKLISKLKAI